jgi:mono/diheme cytochrome c family protein
MPWPGVLLFSFLNLAMLSYSSAVLAAPGEEDVEQVTAETTVKPVLSARVIAVGIPGAGAVASVGFFHPGGPIHDKPEFAAFTKPGRILDPKRILVASSSNFGAQRAATDASEGAILSLDPDGPIIQVPQDFGKQGIQASALDGRLQLFTAQSPGFLNAVNNPAAVTASLPPVSNPLSISLNNAFGRLWFANAPQGALGTGTVSIVDPAGQPLANAPSRIAGGVFAGELTGRKPQAIEGGLSTGAMATALIGMSSDGSRRAVFAALTADGGLVQVHTEQAVDGLAPAGTVGGLPVLEAPRGADIVRASVQRAGMVFNWVPDRILYVADPVRNAIVALKLTTDNGVFRPMGTHLITLPELSRPVDLAPVVPEVVNPAFSSNTTLAGASDFYVANRGDGTIVRLRQDGSVVAVRRIAIDGSAPLGAGRLNGIGVSPDAQRIWVTVSGTLPDYPDSPGMLLEIPAFGPGRSALRERDPRMLASEDAADIGLRDFGAAVFRTDFTAEQGLGPLYNERSCLACHGSPTAGGMGADGLGIVNRVGRFDGQSFDPLVGRGGPVARSHFVVESGFACEAATGIPAAANLVSLRNATALFGLGLIEAIPDATILAGANPQGRAGGHPNHVRDTVGRERVGRYGWKADIGTLEQFVAVAFRNELGITSPLAPDDLVIPQAECARTSKSSLEDDGTLIHAVAAYVASLPPPVSAVTADPVGRAVFAAIGCQGCHTPALHTGNIRVPLYSDLLLHDMGPTLADGVVQGDATGTDWRTMPLWGLGTRKRFLHDGRATGIAEAVLAHDGEAASSAVAFHQLSQEKRDALLSFLSSL